MSKDILLWLLVFLTCVSQVFGQTYPLPDGWNQFGDVQGYDIGVDLTTSYGTAPGRSGFIKSIKPFPTNAKSVSLQQVFVPREYLGKRVRLSCFIKYNLTNELAYVRMAMTIYSINGGTDDMSNRPIKGIGNWTGYNIVLDVPEDTSRLYFGITMNGEGETWLDECKFETVDNSVSSTMITSVAEPVFINVGLKAFARYPSF